MRSAASRPAGNDVRHGTSLLRQWAGVLGPPLIWAARIGASYVLVPVVCTSTSVVLLHVVTAAAVSGAAALGLSAWTEWRNITAAAAAVDDDPATGRHRFMALLGVFSSALFVAVIAAEGLANFFLDPCHVAGPLRP